MDSRNLEKSKNEDEVGQEAAKRRGSTGNAIWRKKVQEIKASGRGEVSLPRDGREKENITRERMRETERESEKERQRGLSER